MASAVFTGIVSGVATYADGTGMAYTGSGQFCTELKIGGQKYDVDSIYSPGVSGGGTKDYSFREQMVTVKVTYVGASETAIIAQWIADCAAFARPSTLVAGGITFNACIFQSAEAEQVKSTGLGTFRMNATIEVKSTR